MCDSYEPKIPDPVEMITYVIGKGELIGLTRDQLLENPWIEIMSSSCGISKEEVSILAETLIYQRNHK